MEAAGRKLGSSADLGWACSHMWSRLTPRGPAFSSQAQTCPYSKGQGTRVKVERVQVYFQTSNCITTANILLAKGDHMAELSIKGQENIFYLLMWGATQSHCKWHGEREEWTVGTILIMSVYPSFIHLSLKLMRTRLSLKLTDVLYSFALGDLDPLLLSENVTGIRNITIYIADWDTEF